MNQLLTIFEELSYEEVLSIADEYNFFPSVELDKNAFDNIFAKYICDHDFTDEILQRYQHKNVDDIVDGENKILRLFPFQVRHKELMIEGLTNNITFINASETGTGKTYETLSLAETERRPLIVICPKSMVSEWYILGLEFNIEILAVCNYETFIRGKMYQFKTDADMDKLPRVDCPYLKRVENEKFGRKKKDIQFEWKNLPENTLVVFDEAHYCKNSKAQRTQLLISLYNYASHPENRWRKINILLLSATIIERKENLIPFMYVLGYVDDHKQTSPVESADFSVKAFGKKLIAERRLTRATMNEARQALDDWHSSDIRPKVFDLDEESKTKIQQLCKEIRDILLKTEGKGKKNGLAERIKKRQEIEALKVGIMFNECKKLREEGYSMLLFVNFRDSLNALETMIKKEMPHEKYALIVGGQSVGERTKERKKFQNGEVHIIIAMLQAGGTGISLHDIKGGYPKYALISPPESATQTVQCLGRLDRLGAKTDSVQRIIFIADTLEEQIAANLNNKIKTIGDLHGEDEKVDNLFLFDKYHTYEEDEPTNNNNNQDDQIKIDIDKEQQKIVVTIPDYFVDSFESNIPSEAAINMRIHGDKYYFDLKHFYLIKSYIEERNV